MTRVNFEILEKLLSMVCVDNVTTAEPFMCTMFLYVEYSDGRSLLTCAIENKRSRNGGGGLIYMLTSSNPCPGFVRGAPVL